MRPADPESASCFASSSTETGLGGIGSQDVICDRWRSFVKENSAMDFCTV